MSTVDLLAGNGLLHVADNVLGSIDPRTMHASAVSVNATAIYMTSKVIDADIFDEKGVRVSTCDKLYLLILLEIFYSSFLGSHLAVFRSASQLKEAANGVLTINIPGIQANREIVGYPDGGLKNPMPLLFDPGFNRKEFSEPDKKFTYLTLSNVQRPKSDEDLAFMSVSYCNYGTVVFLEALQSMLYIEYASLPNDEI